MVNIVNEKKGSMMEKVPMREGAGRGKEVRNS